MGKNVQAVRNFLTTPTNITVNIKEINLVLHNLVI